MSLTDDERKDLLGNLDIQRDEMRPLGEDEKDAFWDWFFDNASKYPVSAIHDSKILENPNIIESRCYKNALFISNKYSKKYIECYCRSLDIGYFIGHGFNSGHSVNKKTNPTNSL